MAKTFELRIFDLLAEFFAHAFRIFAALEHARTVAPCALQAILNGLDDFRVRIECYFHAAIISYTVVSPGNAAGFRGRTHSTFPPSWGRRRGMVRTGRHEESFRAGNLHPAG